MRKEEDKDEGPHSECRERVSLQNHQISEGLEILRLETALHWRLKADTPQMMARPRKEVAADVHRVAARRLCTGHAALPVLLDTGWGPPPLSIVKFEVRTCFLHFTNSCQHPNLLETGQSRVLDTAMYCLFVDIGYPFWNFVSYSGLD